MENHEIKTIDSYSKSIKEKYHLDKKNGALLSNLYELTAGSIRKTCLNLIDQKLSLADEIIMKNFFELKKSEELRNKVKKYDLDKFKPMIKFLKKETEYINSMDALNLIALLINFEPRPYTNYIKIDNKPQKLRSSNVIINNLDTNQTTIKDGSETIVNENEGIIKILIEKRKIVILFSLIIALVFAITSINHQRWMEWQNDHYIEVDFDSEKLTNGKLKLYKEDRIVKFKRITTDCNTKFFNEDGSVKIWYGKNLKKELEYFTDLGLHPETGKTLKPITSYMINKYICPTN